MSLNSSSKISILMIDSIYFFKGDQNFPGQVGQLAGALSWILKGHRFDSQSGHMPRAGSVPGWGAYGRPLVDASLSH